MLDRTIWAAIFLLAFALRGPGPTLAGTLETTSDAKCFALLKGEIDRTDVELITNALQKPASEMTKRSLCFDSPGGDFAAGLAIAKLLQEKAIATRVPAGADCYSACAVAFMGGSERDAKSGDLKRDRTLHVQSKLGFHAPFYVQSREGRWSATTVERLHASALHALAELIELEIVDTDLLVEFARKGPNELLLIDTVDKAGRWWISLDGVLDGRQLTPESAHTACFNMYGWQRPGPSLLLAVRRNYPCPRNCTRQHTPPLGSKYRRIFEVAVEIYLPIFCLVLEAKDGSLEIATYGKLGPDTPRHNLPAWHMARPTTAITELATSVGQLEGKGPAPSKKSR